MLNSEQVNFFRKNGYCKIKQTPEMSKHFKRLVYLSKHLFSLPKAKLESMDISKTGGLRGYTYGYEDGSSQGFISDAEKTRSYAAFDFGFCKNDLTSDIEKILYAKNQWPENFSSFKEKAITSLVEYNSIAINLLAEILSVNRKCIDRYFELPTGNMRMLKYTPTSSPSIIPNHRDYEFLTLVFSTYPALRVTSSDKSIIELKETHDELIFLAGDCLEYLTGGDIMAPCHEVKCSVERYSFIYFLSVDAGVHINSTGKFSTEVSELEGDCFSPAVHIAKMNLCNHSSLRKLYKNSYLVSSLPENGKNPFLGKFYEY